jgi:colanic acid/amylovoran biosynthesis glycosyltransferase
MNIAYLCNSFPEPSESYVGDEIEALRHHLVNVIACSVRRPAHPEPNTVYFFPLKPSQCLAATWLLLRRFPRIRDLVVRVLRGPEPVSRRIRALAHTWLGAYYVVALRKSPTDHIHVHHGYFASWIGMVAARLLKIGFSMTLHGSDLLLRADYLDTKLQNCRFCFTVSEFNRGYILNRYPAVDPDKIFVQPLGIDPELWKPPSQRDQTPVFRVLSVGRLHPVKNHAFLLLASSALRSAGVECHWTIAGEGDERPRLERLRAQLGLEDEVELLGHVVRSKLRDLYVGADLVVLTSLSEGIPLVLMEAMAMECVVLAPAITGIPELVIHGETGFLYEPSSMEDFLEQLQFLHSAGHLLQNIRRAARQHVTRNFNSRVNLARFTETLLSRLQAPRADGREEQTHEDTVLQQVQFSVQRH